MPTIRPFRAVRYAEEADLPRVTCPPYDVISASQRESLELLHPENFVRVVLPSDPPDGEGQTKYDLAADYLKAWMGAGILVTDSLESLYLYRTDYMLEGISRSTAGVIGSLLLEPLGAGIYPHEATMSAPKADRRELMKTTSASLEPVWLVGARSSGRMRETADGYSAKPPLADFEDTQGVRHRLWALDPPQEALFVSWVREVDLVIADGHHRYETAFAYGHERAEMEGNGPWDYTMALIVDPEEYGPALLPIHRIAEGIEPESLLAGVPAEPYPGKPEDLAAEVLTHPGNVGVVCFDRSWTIPTPSRGGDIDAAYVEEILGRVHADVRYEHDLATALAEARRGALTFLMSPVVLDVVLREALSDRRMPPKTTLFWPKPVSGLLLRVF